MVNWVQNRPNQMRLCSFLRSSISAIGSCSHSAAISSRHRNHQLLPLLSCHSLGIGNGTSRFFSIFVPLQVRVASCGEGDRVDGTRKSPQLDKRGFSPDKLSFSPENTRTSEKPSFFNRMRGSSEKLGLSN